MLLQCLVEKHSDVDSSGETIVLLVSNITFGMFTDWIKRLLAYLECLLSTNVENYERLLSKVMALWVDHMGPYLETIVTSL